MKIVVRGTNWVGDAVMSIPALRALRAIFPAARITLHTRSWARGIFEDADFINEILTFDKTDAKVADVFDQTKILKEKNFDLAVLFPNSFESALVAKLARIPRRFGYSKEGRGILLTDRVPVPAWKNERHEAFYYLNLIAEIEKAYFGRQTVAENELIGKLKVSQDRRQAARDLFEEAGVDTTKRIAALGVGSTNSRAKRWPAERFAALNDLIQNELDMEVVIVGAADERDVAAEVYEKSNKKPIVLTGKTSLSEAVEVLSEIDLMVSNDMGLAHIAPAVDTPTLVIFGPTNEKTTRPLGAEIIRKNPDCAPCMLRDCPIDHRCMTEISPREVFEKIKEMQKNWYEQ